MINLTTWTEFERTGRITPELIQGLIEYALELGRDMAAVSDRQHKANRHFPRPMLQSHALGLSLDSLQGCAVRKFQGPEMSGLDVTHASEDVEQSRVVGVSVGMQGKSLHRATVSVPHGL